MWLAGPFQLRPLFLIKAREQVCTLLDCPCDSRAVLRSSVWSLEMDFELEERQRRDLIEFPVRAVIIKHRRAAAYPLT